MAWNKDFRVEGVPADGRYDSIEEAEAARRRVRSMVPNRTKGKKETGGRRPNYITAERAHHSRGRKWAEFLESMGFDKLSEYEQQLLMDSSKLGGSEVFAQWKQREYEKWVPIDRVVVYSYSDRDVIKIRLKDGSVIEQPYEDEKKVKEKRRKLNRKLKRDARPKHCSTCGMSLPTSIASHQTQCSSCQPVAAADAFFANLMKDKQEA